MTTIVCDRCGEPLPLSERREDQTFLIHLDRHRCDAAKLRNREAATVSEALLSMQQERDHLLGWLQRLCRSADKLLDCLDEFDAPRYCAERAEELDATLDAAARAGYYERAGAP